MQVSLFNFNLPTKYIAQKPAHPRDSSRLLHINAQEKAYLKDCYFKDLPNLLVPGDLIIFNNTRVIPARLIGHKTNNQSVKTYNNARIEVTLFQQLSPTCWRAFIKPARKIKLGDKISFAPHFSTLVQSKRSSGEVDLLFSCTSEELKANIATHGFVPLPPYIKRGRTQDLSDQTNYQTMFASYDGAIAAPTAALHFTPKQIKLLKHRDVNMAELTLHVGAGTFLPVRTEDTVDHSMHSEWGQILPSTAKIINETKQKGRRVIACGTTVLRLLETAASENGNIRPFKGETQLFITPGYHFKIVDLLLTNFHQPKSTLFMLVAAFAGLDRIKNAYEHAQLNSYRFYSYGDCSLIERIEL